MSDFDIRIAEKQKSLDATIERLDVLRLAFIPAAAKFVAEWWTKTARDEVERAHAVTVNLRDAELSELKAGLTTLVTDAERHVKEFFSDGGTWWHLQQPLEITEFKDRTHSYRVQPHRGPEVIEKALRLVLGKLAPLLEKYGYLAPTTGGHGLWREWDKSGMHHPANARPYYPTSLNWPKELTPIVNKYDAEKTAAEQLLREMATIEEEKRTASAKKRWDSA